MFASQRQGHLDMGSIDDEPGMSPSPPGFKARRDDFATTTSGHPSTKKNSIPVSYKLPETALRSKAASSSVLSQDGAQEKNNALNEPE